MFFDELKTLLAIVPGNTLLAEVPNHPAIKEQLMKEVDEAAYEMYQLELKVIERKKKYGFCVTFTCFNKVGKFTHCDDCLTQHRNPRYSKRTSEYSKWKRNR